MRVRHAAALLLGALLLAAPRPGQAQVLGDVFLYEAGQEDVLPPFPDLPADFGPEVPVEGIDGLLLAADPADACTPLRNQQTDEPWVALISRSQQHTHPSNCTFDVKVRHAELAGAMAAVVFDDVFEALIIMSKPRDHPEPGIPAVFVSEKAGVIMRKLLTPGVTRVRILPVSASAWMSLLMSAFLGFLALTVVLATFWTMRAWSLWLGRTRRRGLAPELAGLGPQPPGHEGLPASVIRALPIIVYEGRSSSKHRGSRPPAGGVAAHGPLGGAGSSPPPGDGEQAGSEPVRGRARRTGSTGSAGSASSAAAVFLARPGGELDDASEQPCSSWGSGLDTPPALEAWAGQPGSSTGASGLVSFAALAALRRPHSAPPPDASCSGASSPGGSRPGSPRSPCAAAGGADAAASAPQPASPAPSDALSSPLLSTDDEGDVPVGARGGATRHACVICIERYAVGDKLRVLPFCQHRFHAHCIDPWLTTRSLCPVCKHDASQWPPAQPGAAAGAAEQPPPVTAAGGQGAARGGAGTGALLLGGHHFWFLTRLRARLARARQHQQQQEQQAHVPAAVAAAAAADAAEAGLLQPEARLPLLLGGQQLPQPLQQPRRLQLPAGFRLMRQWQHHHGHQHALPRGALAGGSRLREPLLPPQPQPGPLALEAADALPLLPLPSPPLPIPGLTPPHSHASSFSSRTDSFVARGASSSAAGAPRGSTGGGSSAGGA